MIRPHTSVLVCLKPLQSFRPHPLPANPPSQLLQDLTPWGVCLNFRNRHSHSRAHPVANVIPATKHYRTHVTGQPLCPAEVHALERLVRQVIKEQPRAQAEEPHGEGHRAQDADGEHAEARRGVEVPVSSGLGAQRLGASC